MSVLGLSRRAVDDRTAEVDALARRLAFAAMAPSRRTGEVWAAQRRRRGGRVLLGLDEHAGLTVTVEQRGTRWWVQVGPGVPLGTVERLLRTLLDEVAERWTS